MSYVPRLVAPSATDPWWIHVSRGGFNSCIVIDQKTGSCIPNCVGYAWGRFSELLGQPSTLCRGNAGTWFNYVQDGYQRGQIPQEGAVMCFSKPGEAGHVCIVEKVNKDLSVVTSESGYMTTRFWVGSRKPPYNYSGYMFQGFIYNPNAYKSKLDLFLETAESQVNQPGSWTFKTAGIASNQSWAAAFVVACAKSVEGLINVIIPNTFSASGIGRVGILRHMGEWLPGPRQGDYPEPKVGDIVCFRTNRVMLVNTYQSDSCGIVTETSGNTMSVVQGDCSGYVRKTTHNIGNSIINGYFRPDWERVDTNSDITVAYRDVQGLYTSQVAARDAAVREVGYLNSNFKPSIIPSKIKLSVLNYTGLLGDLYSVFGGTLATSTASNTADQAAGYNVASVTDQSVSAIAITGMNSSERIVLSFLIEKGLNPAAACGVCANIKAESNFNTAAVGDKGTSFGICQWHNNRGTSMKRIAGDNWSTNLTGQLNYLWFELCNSYKSVLNGLKACPYSLEGARQAADIFVRKFEVPANVDTASLRRQATAEAYFKLIINQL